MLYSYREGYVYSFPYVNVVRLRHRFLIQYLSATVEVPIRAEKRFLKAPRGTVTLIYERPWCVTGKRARCLKISFQPFEVSVLWSGEVHMFPVHRRAPDLLQGSSPLHSGWTVNGKAFNMADHCVVQTVSHWRNVCQSQLSGLHWSDLSLDPLLKSQVGFHWPAASEVIKTAAHAGRTRHKSDLTQPRSCNFDLSWVISASLIEDSTDLHTFSTVGIWGDRTEWWSLLCVVYLEASS